MSNALFGRASQDLYNQHLTDIHESIKYLNSIIEPQEAPEGALWIDNGILKVKNGGKFIVLYENYFQSMNGLIQNNSPLNPKPGQLWLNEGALIFYNGIKWEPVKALALEDFSMDGFEPFIIIDSVAAGANEIVNKQLNIIEEEFIGAKGTFSFVLQKGTYTPSRNKISVYINGRIVPKNSFYEYSSSEIKLLNPLEAEERIVIQYVPSIVESKVTYFPLKFHPQLREEVITISQAGYTINLPTEIIGPKEYTMLYVNGRFVPSTYYFLETQKTIRTITQIQPGDEVIVQYIDVLIETPPLDGTSETINNIAYSQYLWPSTEYDRLFINGKINTDFNVINKVTIQYQSDDVQGKQLSAIHIHPRNLCNVIKRAYAFDKTNPFIQCDEAYTEFYGVKLDNKIDESQFMRSHLYADVETRQININEEQKSYILPIEAGTKYTFQRKIQTNEFKLIECASLPTKDSIYMRVIELTATSLQYVHDYTPLPDVKYLIIQLGTDSINWCSPIATKNKSTYISKLLIKTSKSDTDYITSLGGITLSNYVANEFEYILAIHYVFAETMGRGILSKKSFIVSEDSQIVIDYTSDPILVFAQGHYLIQQDNYLYDTETGLITLLFPEQLDIGIISFPKLQTGMISQITSDKKGIVVPQTQMNMPLLFIYGEEVQSLVDFEIINGVYYVLDAQIGMSYAIVDCVDDNGSSIFVNQGLLEYDSLKQKYYVTTVENFAEITPILFVDGLLITHTDLYYENDKLYIENGGSVTSKYTLLKDTQNRFMHSQIKRAGNFVTGISANESLIYIDGNIINDIATVGCSVLPQSAYENEIKATIHYSETEGYVVEKWYVFTNGEWVEITDTSRLTNCFIHYVLEDKVINFKSTTPFLNKKCYGWFYQFDSHIEHPLMYGTILNSTNKINSVYQHHAYMMQQNALSVFVNGYRQYPITERLNGVKEVTRTTFELAEIIPNSKIDYIVELPEKEELKSCEIEILFSNQLQDKLLRTKMPLAPGFITCYIDGIRQSKNNFEIVDVHTLYFPGFIKDERFTNKFLIEYRKDMHLQELTYTLEYDGQTAFLCDKDLRVLLYAKDHIKIYFNGLYLGRCYQIDYIQSIITIPYLKDFAKKNDTIIFEWR